MEQISFLTIFSIGFLGSFSHCSFMCGGFVTLLNLNRNSGFILNFTYQISRIFSYIFLGGFFGYFGGIFAFSPASKATLFFIVGLLLVFIGMALFIRGDILKLIENDSFSRMITAKIFRLKGDNKFINLIFFGLLNGLLPCGLVYYFLAMAILSESALNGMFVMSVFGISTLPVMLFLGFFLRIMSEKFRNFMFKFSIFIIIVNGFYISYLGFIANG